MQEYPETHSDREEAILNRIKDIDYQLNRNPMQMTLYEETVEEKYDNYRKERDLLMDELEPIHVNQKQIKIITDPYEGGNPFLSVLRVQNKQFYDYSNYIAQCCIAACLDIPFINTKGFTFLIPKLSDIPEIISNMEPETGYFIYKSPFDINVKTNWLDWFFFIPKDEVDARKLHNLEKIYQMTGTIPKEFVPYIPEDKIFIHPTRIETHIDINHANEIGKPIYYDTTTNTWKFSFGRFYKKKENDEPKSIELIETKPKKLTEMEMLIIYH